MVKRCLLGNDFKEGVRALLIDKDQNPKWSPLKLQDISADFINSYFETFSNPKDELEL